MTTRRTLLAAALAPALTAALTDARPAAAQAATPAAGAATPASAPMAITGKAVPELAGFDQTMTALMARWGLPGGQLAVAKDGRLVFNRGYGLADVAQQTPVQPDARFRIASVSKPITTVAILILVDAGKLSLDEAVFPLLGLQPAAHATRDPRLDTITVEDLLVHAGGWDSTTGVDPQYLPWSRMAAATMGLADPPEATTIVRYMLGVPLDFAPGSQSVYSNFGFNVLGRVIEHVSGQPYADYVQTHVLGPAGVTGMRLGRTRRDDRAPGEVSYYGPPELALAPSVFWGEGYVPDAYGGFYLEAMDAHGGWIATAADLVRFTTAVDGQRGKALLAPATVQAMVSTPRPQAGGAGAGNGVVRAGLGWGAEPADGGVDWSHAGALDGSTASWLFRGANGVTLAYIFNSLPIDYGTFFPSSIQAMRAAANAVRTWPDGDLFSAAAPAATPGE